MLQIDGKQTLKKKRGNTNDIISEVINTYSETCYTTSELAATLRRDTEIETCRAVFDYIIENINYKEDPDGVQWIRTPARLIHDREGDCKSMAILTASILNNVGITCFFRFVSFSQNRQITHVYVVTESGIIIDPVERVNGKPVFNYASNYTYKKDMNTTQISRLSGVGAIEDIYTPYMSNTNLLDNTIAENYLFSELDYLNTLCKTFPTEIENYNKLDRIVVAYNLYKQATGYTQLIERAGQVLQNMEDNRCFELSSLDEAYRHDNLSMLINTALEMLADGSTLNYTADGIYLTWWNLNIKNKDYNGLSEEQKTALSGCKIGATNSNSLLTDIQKSAPYFLYLYLGQEWATVNKRLFPKVYAKYLIEYNVFENWVYSFDNFLDRNTIYNNLRSGFLKKTNQTPEQFINKVLKANGYKIGIAPAIIAAIISGIAAVIVAVINYARTCKESQATNIDNYPSGTPDDNDFTVDSYNADIIDDSNNGSKKGLIIGAVAILLLLFTKKSKKNGTDR